MLTQEVKYITGDTTLIFKLFSLKTGERFDVELSELVEKVKALLKNM